MEVDAAIQDERAVNLISTQVDAVDDQDVVVLAARVDEGSEDDEVDGELAVEVGADGRDVPAVGPAGEELGLRAVADPSGALRGSRRWRRGSARVEGPTRHGVEPMV